MNASWSVDFAKSFWGEAQMKSWISNSLDMFQIEIFFRSKTIYLV